MNYLRVLPNKGIDDLLYVDYNLENLIYYYKIVTLIIKLSKINTP